MAEPKVVVSQMQRLMAKAEDMLSKQETDPLTSASNALRTVVATKPIQDTLQEMVNVVLSGQDGSPSLAMTPTALQTALNTVITGPYAQSALRGAVSDVCAKAAQTSIAQTMDEIMRSIILEAARLIVTATVRLTVPTVTRLASHTTEVGSQSPTVTTQSTVTTQLATVVPSTRVPATQVPYVQYQPTLRIPLYYEGPIPPMEQTLWKLFGILFIEVHFGEKVYNIYSSTPHFSRALEILHITI